MLTDHLAVLSNIEDVTPHCPLGMRSTRTEQFAASPLPLPYQPYKSPFDPKVHMEGLSSFEMGVAMLCYMKRHLPLRFPYLFTVSDVFLACVVIYTSESFRTSCLELSVPKQDLFVLHPFCSKHLSVRTDSLSHTPWCHEVAKMSKGCWTCRGKTYLLLNGGNEIVEALG